MPSHDPAVQLQNLSLQHPQLDAESSDTGARDLGQPAGIGNDPEQLIDTVASDRGDDSDRRFSRRQMTPCLPHHGRSLILEAIGA